MAFDILYSERTSPRCRDYQLMTGLREIAKVHTGDFRQAQTKI